MELWDSKLLSNTSLIMFNEWLSGVEEMGLYNQW